MKLNRTLNESPATASLHSATPKRKKVPCVSVFRGGGFFLKWKGHFSFWGSALQVFGQCGGAKCGLGFVKTIFWGGFSKTSADFFCIYPRGRFNFWRTNFTIASLCLRWRCGLPKKRFVVYYGRNNKECARSPNPPRAPCARKHIPSHIKRIAPNVRSMSGFGFLCAR